jgi:hypothetical protein
MLSPHTALLAFVGLVAEAEVVETQAVAAAALGGPGGGRVAAALVAASRLAAERGGESARVPEGRLHVRDSRGCSGSGGSGLLRGLRHPELIATLDELLRCLEGPRVDQVADVARQFAEEKGSLCIHFRLRLQGGEVVPQDGGPGVSAHGIIQPLVGHLLGAEAVGSQEELLQLLVRVADGGGIPRQRADGGDQRER